MSILQLQEKKKHFLKVPSFFIEMPKVLEIG